MCTVEDCGRPSVIVLLVMPVIAMVRVDFGIYQLYVFHSQLTNRMFCNFLLL